MRIRELYIAEFGGIKNKKIELDAGQKLNIIYGENESGKSTIFLFIKFMLYGLQRKSASNTERERSLSWSGSAAAGSMTLEHNGKDYRIERSFVDRAKGEKLVILSLESGAPISTDKSPGEYFLGVPREVFESSACVGQMRSDDINGEKTAQSLSNLLSSADEGVDVSTVLRELNLIRASYLHKNQGGGMIFEDEAKINSLRMKLEEAKNASIAIEGKTEGFDRIKKEYEAMKLELEENDALVSQFNKIAIIKRFEALRAKEAELGSFVGKKEQCAEAALATDYFPDRTHIAELRAASRDLADKEKSLEAKEQRIIEHKITYDPELAEFGERVEQSGGKIAVVTSLTEPMRKAALRLKIGATFGVSTAIAAGISAVGFVLSLIAVAIIALVATLGLGTAAVIITANAVRERNDAIEASEKTAYSYHTTPEGLSERLDEALEELALMREHIAERARLEAELDLAEESLEASKQHAYKLLTLTMGASAEPECEMLEAEALRLDEFLNRYDELAREEDTFLRVLENERNSLARYDEDKLRSEITVNIEDATPEAVEEAERSKSFLLAKKTACESRINLLQNELVALRIKAEDPLPIADRLALLEAKNKKDREFYEALVLAMSVIEESSAAMRGSVTPIISKTASEYLARMSADKYNTLRTNSKLGLMLDKDGFSIGSELLSAGTKDTAYIALRLALIMQIYKNANTPIILDESFCQLDDKRLARTVELLGSLAGEGIQIIMFTSHLREAEACRRAELEHNEILL